MKKIIAIRWLFSVALTGCVTPSINYKTLPSVIPGLQDSTNMIVIIDAAEIHTPGIAVTKKREAVITQIKQDYIIHLPEVVAKYLGNPSVVDTSLSDEEKILLLNKDPSAKQKIFDKYRAAMILILKDCAGGFNQDEVVKEKQRDGSTSKTAYYSVFFQTSFCIIQPQESWDKEINASRKHSSRSVLSGLLARGPGYEANRKDIVQMAEENAKNITGLFREQKIAVGWMKEGKRY